MSGNRPARVGAEFETEIDLSYLLSTLREMRASTARSAYSTCFAEGEDFTCGILTPDGRLAAQAGLPGHSGTLLEAMGAVLAAYDEFQPGDVFIHNDPFNGGSHQADVMLGRPLYFDGELFGFAVNKGHWIDVGGGSAGGWDGSVTHSSAEGLIIPPIKLYEAGRLRTEIRDLILRNVRMPHFVWGDLQAQIASSIVAERRLAELAVKRGREGVLDLFEAAIDRSRRHFLAHLKDASHGSAEATDVMEDDAQGHGPYPVKVRIDVSPEGVRVDFTGTALQARSPINATIANAKAASYAAVLAAIDPEVPMSSGCLDLIEVIVPKGSLLNATEPAPIYSGTADPANRATETILRAFANLDPRRVAAGSYATGNNSVGYGFNGDGDEYLWYVFESGGLGGRSHADGNSAEWHLLPNCKNESMEVWEARQPVEFEHYSLVPDSGGPGRYRGGLGTERALRVRNPTSVHAVADRHKVPPWGLEGGRSGTCNSIRIVRDGRSYRPTELGAQSDSKFGSLELGVGDVYVVRQGGGGGYGSPSERPPEEVLQDVRSGYVSPDSARRDYSVALDANDQDVDLDATAALRAKS